MIIVIAEREESLSLNHRGHLLIQSFPILPFAQVVQGRRAAARTGRHEHRPVERLQLDANLPQNPPTPLGPLHLVSFCFLFCKMQ